MYKITKKEIDKRGMAIIKLKSQNSVPLNATITIKNFVKIG
jgi:hypothetical protein